ncbi:MAG: hypothetical protein M3N46_14820 [Actinomycetota bacterium]|nr:hypothetical protein [Actinomycetota bacterium]
MSLSFLTKPIGGPKKESDAPTEPGQGKPAMLGRGQRGASPAVGGVPRVDLIPPEIRLKRAQLRTRRSLRLGLFGVFVVVVVACAGTWVFNGLAQTALVGAQAQQQALTAEQSKYSNVTTVQGSIDLIKAGQVVGDSSEINWQSYLSRLQSVLPGGVSISSVTVDSATPLKAYAQTTTPLQGDRIATLQFTASSPSLPSIPALLDGLKQLPGFVDATPGSVTLTDKGYLADVVLHISSDALAKRFAAQATKTSASSGASSTGGN